MYEPINLGPWEGGTRPAEGRLTTPPTVVVGGTGGSGTRIVVQLLSDLGVQMGANRNDAGDAMPFTSLYDGHINRYLSGALRTSRFLHDLGLALDAHLDDGATKGPWGWKNPRSIYLMPLWAKLWPHLVYIHVVRDGMAMATSANQAQLTKHGTAVLGPAYSSLPAAHQSMMMWAMVNTAAADYGATIGARYLRLRYEDICQSPTSAMQTIADALGLTGARQCSVRIRAMRPRDTTTTVPFDSHARLTTETALRRFGYSQ